MSVDLERRIRKLQSILDIARAMTLERDLDSLLVLILREAARMVEADRCSLFLADRERGELWSKIAHGTEEIRIPMGAGIAGAVATSGLPLRIADAYRDARFNREIDLDTGYHTRSILCVPMISTSREVVGVIQALNRRDGDFTAEDEDLLIALGGQAASAIENAILHAEIEQLFEGFVRASAVAIEARDPTTAGHSGRVAELCVALARAVEADPPATFQGVTFTTDDLRQLRYAALLHDFGKVGVRENVLVKADKLYPHEREVLRARFDVIRARLELQHAQALFAHGDAEELGRQIEELDGLWQLVLDCNRPTVLPEDQSRRLKDLSSRTWWTGTVECPYLTPEEIARLAIPMGSLSEAERHQIESHVTHSHNFLVQIPWTRSLRRVPEIAWGHHEKLDGKGYPQGLDASRISIETRIMTIADIYDALTASDRPYKKAMPVEMALKILAQEARKGSLDGELLEVFVKASVWKVVEGL